jgi:hypothetical protein
MKRKILFCFVVILFYQISFAQDSLKKGINYFAIYNSDIAKADIAKGKVQIIEQAIKINGKKLKGSRLICGPITSKYGFCYLYIQDISDRGEIIDALYSYNSVVYDYLTEKNGEGWRDEMHADYDSINPYKIPYHIYPKINPYKPSQYKIKIKKELSKLNLAFLTIEVKDNKEDIPFANVHVFGNNLDTTFVTDFEKGKFSNKPIKIKTNPGKIQISTSYVGYAPLLTDSIELKPNTNTKIIVLMESRVSSGGIADIKCKCSLSDEEINKIRDDIHKAKSSEKVEKLKIFRKHGKCWFEGWEI